MAIRELLIVSHTHTDVGYTDHADTLWRHQDAIIDDALDLIEREAHREDASRFRWTCEVTLTTTHWFRTASTRQKDRFRDFQAQGLLAAGAMPMHWTPLVSPATALRSLRHLRDLRAEGVDARVAIQCDVNGLGWFWTDLLLDIGVDSLLMGPNPHRGMPFELQQRPFRWRTPSGRELFTLHGWHYSVGTNVFFLGDDDPARTQGTIDRVLGDLERRGDYPWPVALMPATNPAATDNGFATRGLSDFVERWNAEGRTPRLRLATVEQAMDAVRAAVAEGPEIPAHGGDWSDFWVDGVGSTAYETMLARSAERLLPVIDLLASFSATGDDRLLDRAAQEVELYDEHTWGAFCSITRPDSPFSRIQLNWKTSRAHNGFALAQEAVRVEALKRTREVADGAIEGDHRRRRLDDAAALAAGRQPREEQSYYVLNPSPVPRRVRWPVTRDRAGVAPQTILDAYQSERYLTGMLATGLVADASDLPSATHVIAVDLPPFGEAVVRPVEARPDPGAAMGPGFIETSRWRLEVDPADGSLRSLRDRRDGREVVDPSRPLGRMVYETLVDPEAGRAALFGGKYDWSRLETLRWPDAPLFTRRPADTVRLGEPRGGLLGLEIAVSLEWSHGDAATVTWRLPHDGEGVEMDTVIRKQPVESPESIYVLFGLAGDAAEVRLDVGDRVIDPVAEQVPGSCQAWMGVQGFAALATDQGALVVAAPDTPLVQPFGIQTENAGRDRQGREPCLAFWALNNHWDTNFAASQSGGIPARFRLLPQARLDLPAARAFAETANTAPVVVRAYDSTPSEPRPLLEVVSADEVIARVRRSWRGNGLVLTLANPGEVPTRAMVRLPSRCLGAARLVDPMERPVEGGALVPSDATLQTDLLPGAVRYVQLDLA